MAEIDSKVCQLCEQEAFKYKCPKCSFKSCSLKCSKEHVVRELCHPDQQPAERQPAMAPVVEFEEEFVVPAARLEQLRHSEKLRSLLSNRHLREILRKLDSSRQPWKDLGNLMLEPLFVEFTDACLEVIEPQEDRMQLDS